MVNQEFNPKAINSLWAGDVTYLKTGEGWMYLATVMDLYSRRTVGWHIDKRMTKDLITKAFVKAKNTRQLKDGPTFHSDRGSQYTIKHFRYVLNKYRMVASMEDVGACWDNAVVERLFGRLKHDWIFKVHQPTRSQMKEDVAEYFKYYNFDRLHFSNGSISLINYRYYLL